MIPRAGCGCVCLRGEATRKALLCSPGRGRHSLAPIVRGRHALWPGLTDRFFKLGIWKGRQRWLQFRACEAQGSPMRELILHGATGPGAEPGGAASWRMSHAGSPPGWPPGCWQFSHLWRGLSQPLPLTLLRGPGRALRAHNEGAQWETLRGRPQWERLVFLLQKGDAKGNRRERDRWDVFWVGGRAWWWWWWSFEIGELMYLCCTVSTTLWRRCSSTSRTQHGVMVRSWGPGDRLRPTPGSATCKLCHIRQVA